MMRLNLKTKLSLVFLLLTVLPFGFLGYYTYSGNINTLTETILEKDRDNINLLTKELNNIVNTVPNDLALFEDFYALKRYLTWYYLGEPYKTKSWWRDMRNAFSSLMAAKSLYYSLQIIDLEGKELFKIETESLTQIKYIVPNNELQNVSHEYYFSQTMQLDKKGDVNFSSQFINQQNEMIQLLRYSMLIINKNNVNN